MPHAGDLDYLLSYWQAAGEAASGGMGLGPLTAQELLAWQNGTQTPLLPWEFQIILDISREYVAFLHKAEDRDCLPPYGEAVPEVDKADVSRRLGIALAAMAGKPAGRKRAK